jgi:hypothetical protein
MASLTALSSAWLVFARAPRKPLGYAAGMGKMRATLFFKIET